VSDRGLERALLAQDVAIVAFALWLSHVLREIVAASWPGLKPTVPREEYVALLVAYLPVWVWCADRLGLNRVRVVIGPWMDLVRVLVWTQAWAVTALSVLLVAAQAPFNRSYLAIYVVLSTLLLLIATVPQRGWVKSVRGDMVVVVIGDEHAPAVEELSRVRGCRLERLPRAHGDALRDRLQTGGVDEVVVEAGLEPDRIREMVEICAEVGVAVLVRAEHAAVATVRPAAEVVGSSIYLIYQRREPDRPTQLVKAFADRLLASLALLLLLPFMLLIGLLVKLTSRGPVLFVQPRGGLNGRAFPMLKFRTMREGAEAERAVLLTANEMDGPVFKIRDDPRVTPVGQWLRRTSLDELPQLVNVVLGHMSLVGPRPLPLIETRALVGGQRRRLSVRPGITGLWQVSGRNTLRFDQWMALDLEYVDRWSMGLDLAILLRTVPALLTGRGAR
jgi:exopolysaccharide biosynthesis polyprenyl glycosylphosphotransferase